MFRKQQLLSLLVVAIACSAHATVFARLQGTVVDPQHRPVAGAQVTVRAAHSALSFQATTGATGEFLFSALPAGDYVVLIAQPGFSRLSEPLTLASNTSPRLRFELRVGAVAQTVEVAAIATAGSVTPTTLIDRATIAQTPGADRTSSLAMITDYVPGAYMTHDMLHLRGGHQVSWLIDGVEIPNTNISSNLGAQIDPKDIDYLEVQRGSYSADVGDRTYGVFNVVPRTGFERSREAELVLSAGNFLQASAHLNLGDHTQKLAYYASLTGNRSDYGLAPPVGQVLHDAANSQGGFASLLYNRTPADQFRLVAQVRADFFQIPYDHDPDSAENQQFESSGLRDVQHERDALAAFTWLHTFSPSTLLQVSPFFHGNAADYDGSPSDAPVATTSHRTSNYGGAQATLTTELARNALQVGFYSFGQHDRSLIAAAFHDGSATPGFSLSATATGGVLEAFLSDTYKPADWLTLTAGLRQTHFQGQFAEDYTAPRVGLALRVPRLHWVFRGFYGRFYQPPPLLTASGPVVQYAQRNNTSFAPLHGERDEEHQFGVQIPLHGWIVDADTFKTRANNFLDHSNIGNSSLYYPVTVEGALVRAWEVTVRSPRLGRFGQAHLAYSNQIAQQRGKLTGGLICAPAGDPACDAGFRYTPVDHDQRNTLNVGLNALLPWQLTAAANVYYGSGFVNGNPDPATPYPNAYLPEHTTANLSLGRSFGEHVSASVTAINLANRRVLLDNSVTFGGFHFNDPRELYGELRYRFPY